MGPRPTRARCASRDPNTTPPPTVKARRGSRSRAEVTSTRPSRSRPAPGRLGLRVRHDSPPSSWATCAPGTQNPRGRGAPLRLRATSRSSAIEGAHTASSAAPHSATRVWGPFARRRPPLPSAGRGSRQPCRPSARPRGPPSPAGAREPNPEALSRMREALMPLDGSERIRGLGKRDPRVEDEASAPGERSAPPDAATAGFPGFPIGGPASHCPAFSRPPLVRHLAPA